MNVQSEIRGNEEKEGKEEGIKVLLVEVKFKSNVNRVTVQTAE